MKANNFFFLSAVKSHIDASVSTQYPVTTKITFWHEKDTDQESKLVVTVTNVEKSFVVSYVMMDLNTCIQSAESDELTSTQVYGVIAAIANDAFKA
ncbi:hypothetical protein [Burkholderia pseudomallei]|jgi:hypothetical protein|uniref:hypothetical protein n=1 Tax=Bacteria TaxID=2 RepID=UPI0024DF3677|nr:hypothetical protein [Burkholderia pseudomallei]